LSDQLKPELFWEPLNNWECHRLRSSKAILDSKDGRGAIAKTGRKRATSLTEDGSTFFDQAREFSVKLKA